MTYTCNECPQKCKAPTKKELKRFCVKNLNLKETYKSTLKKDKFVLKEE